MIREDKNFSKKISILTIFKKLYILRKSFSFKYINKDTDKTMSSTNLLQ